MIGFVKLRILEPDDHSVLRGARLKEAMMEDIENGLYPFFVSTTLGTTGCCAFDRLDEIGPVCKVGMSGDLHLRCTVVIPLFWGMLRGLLTILSGNYCIVENIKKS